MNKAIKYPLFLGAVGAFSTFLLSTAYGITAPIIAQRIAEQATAGVREIFPNASSIVNVSSNFSGLEIAGINTIFEVRENGNIVAYGYEATANGYGGKITGLLVLSFTSDQVLGYKTIAHTETKGGNYGDVLLSSNAFNQQFVNLGFSALPDGIDLTAGSTAKVTLNAIKNLTSNVLLFHLEAVKGVEVIIPELINNPLPIVQGLLPNADQIINLKETYPEAKKAGLDLYQVNSGGNPIAYAYATSADGYGGRIISLVLVDFNTNKFVGLKVISHDETEGIGDIVLDSPNLANLYKDLPFSSVAAADISAGVSAPLTIDGFKFSIQKVIKYHSENVKVG
jgi:Na+-translocating ferredoxin:NAD+ oxidoreductase RnfG subunit